jgi:hypothetical protein
LLATHQPACSERGPWTAEPAKRKRPEGRSWKFVEQGADLFLSNRPLGFEQEVSPRAFHQVRFVRLVLPDHRDKPDCVVWLRFHGKNLSGFGVRYSDALLIVDRSSSHCGNFLLRKDVGKPDTRAPGRTQTRSPLVCRHGREAGRGLKQRQTVDGCLLGRFSPAVRNCCASDQQQISSNHSTLRGLGWNWGGNRQAPSHPKKENFPIPTYAAIYPHHL